MQAIDLNWLSDQLVFVNIDITTGRGKTLTPRTWDWIVPVAPGGPGLLGTSS